MLPAILMGGGAVIAIGSWAYSFMDWDRMEIMIAGTTIGGLMFVFGAGMAAG